MDDKKGKTKKKPSNSGGKQPKKQASKNKLAVALRKKKIITALIEGKSVTQAGIDSGLSPKTAASQISQTLNNPKVQEEIAEILRAQGIDDSYLAQKLRSLIEGKKVISAVVINGSTASLSPDQAEENAGRIHAYDEPDVTRDLLEVPDNVALGKGLEIAYKLTGRLNTKVDVKTDQPVRVLIREFCTPDNPNGVTKDDQSAEGNR